jgi:hypothetical protein
MKTSEEERPASDAGAALSNPLLAFISRHCYAPPAPGQVPSPAWLKDPAHHAVWLPTLAAQKHLDVSRLRAALYDVTSISTHEREEVFKAFINSEYDYGGPQLRAAYAAYCTDVVYAQLRLRRRILVVDGVTLYDALALQTVLEWCGETTWRYHFMAPGFATTRWDRRPYTSADAIRCWLSGLPAPTLPAIAPAVKKVGCSRKLPGIPQRLSGTWSGDVWVTFQGEKYIWCKALPQLYGISERRLRRFRQEGVLQSAKVLGQVLIRFDAWQGFLRWYYTQPRTRKHAVETVVPENSSERRLS